MRTIRFIFLSLSILSLLVSCQSKEDVIDEPSSSSISPSQQKKRIQNTIRDAINILDAQNFEEILNLASFFSDEFSDYDIDEEYAEKIGNLGGWDEVKSAVNEAMSILTNNLTHPMSSPSVDYFTLNANISDFYGTFTSSKKTHTFEYEPSSDGILVLFPDKNGKQCSISLKAVGSVKKFSVKVKDEYSGTDKTYRDEYNVTVGIPEQIELTISNSSKVLASLTLEFTLDGSLDVSLSEGRYDGIDELGVIFSSSLLSVSSTVKVDDFKSIQVLSISKKSLDANVSVSSGKTNVISADASIGGNFGRNININGEDEPLEIIKEYIDKIDFNANVLDKIQVYAECKDARKLADALNYADDVDETSKDKVQEAADRLNKSFMSTLCYDNEPQWQSKGVFMLDERYDDWEGKTYYYLTLGLLFADDTKYSCEEFFDSSDFHKLGDDLEKWAKAFGDFF